VGKSAAYGQRYMLDFELQGLNGIVRQVHYFIASLLHRFLLSSRSSRPRRRWRIVPIACPRHQLAFAVWRNHIHMNGAK
jgi:hypothetical protein